MTDKTCKDCAAEGRSEELPILKCPSPGPRCYSHNRAFKKKQRAARHEQHVAKTYGLEPGDYDALCQFQGGVCAICRRAKCRGVSGKHLAVDHDHRTNEPRGLCCVPCNKDLLGRYDIEALQRAIDYLANPPYRQMKEMQAS